MTGSRSPHRNTDHTTPRTGRIPSPVRGRPRVLVVTAVCVCAARVTGYEKVDSLNLSSLFNLEVSSVSKTPELLSDVATSIYVLDQEDIARGNAHRLQDLLFQIPGLIAGDVTYQIPVYSIREKPDIYPQGVNILIDGVPMVSPITGGLFFPSLLLPISEIRRIEAIKGPGATIYGANSATGIINIMTKNARESDGVLVNCEGGNRNYGSVTARYGRALSDRVSLSVYGTAQNHDGYEKNPSFAGERFSLTGDDGRRVTGDNPFADEREGQWQGAAGGIKALWHLWSRATLTSQITHSANRGYEFSSLFLPYDTDTITDRPPADSVRIDRLHEMRTIAQAELSLDFSEMHDAFIRLYNVYSDEEIPGIGSGTAGAAYNSANVEIQDNLRLFAERPIGVQLIGGANARIVTLWLEDTDMLQWLRKRKNDYLYAAFLQSTVSLYDRVQLTGGLKAETWTLLSNEPELMPGVRLTVKPLRGLSVWGAWSRSITTPAYIQTNLELKQAQMPPAEFFLKYPLFASYFGVEPGQVPPSAGKWVTIVNGEDTRPVEYYSTDCGIRFSAFPWMHLDISGFYAVTPNKMLLARLENPPFPTTTSEISPDDTIIPLPYTHIKRGTNYGAETVLDCTPLHRLNLELSHSWFKTEERMLPGFKDMVSRPDLVPPHLLRGKCAVDLPAELRLTTGCLWHSEFVSIYEWKFPAHDFTGSVPTVIKTSGAHVKFDAMIEKSFFHDDLRVSIWGKNLFTDHEVEAGRSFFILYPHTIHRTFGAGIRYQF